MALKQAVLALDGKKVGDITLSEAVFGAPERKDILHRVVNWQLAKKRGGNAKVQERGEVSRTHKKLYNQKGTGGARHASRNANIFVGGAVAHGPRVRKYDFPLQKKVRQLGLKTALSARVREGSFIVLNEAVAKTHKTQDMVKALTALNAESATIIVDAWDDNFDRATRNIKHIKVLPTEGANVFDILKREKLVLTENAVKMLEARLTGEAKAEAKPAKAEKAPAKKTAAKKIAKTEEAK